MNTTRLGSLRPCQCGAAPAFHSWRTGEIRQLQLKCACGAHGAVLMYKKPEDRAVMEQAAIDGWNLAD